MTPTLTAFLLRAHGGHAWPAPGTPIEWRPGHVVLDDTDGTVAALAFEATGAARVACELVLVAPQREASGPDGLADLRFLQSFASASGAHFARPGAGTAGALHRRRFAAPGRVLASGVPGAAAAGALGMLALPACALECAAAMAGEPLLLPRPRVVGVELNGVPDPGVTGHDVLLAVERRLAGEGAGAVLEFHGIGLFSLPVADRLAIAARATAVAGALAALFPSDDHTRAWLRECGRDADWRRLEGPEEGFDDLVSLDLSAVRPERAEGVAVRVGAFAEDEEVHGLARALARSPRAAAIALEVVVPGRVSLEAWTAAGTLAALKEAGAIVLDRADPAAATVPATAVLLGGDPVDDAARERGVWTCAALLSGNTAAEAMVSAGHPRPLPPPVWDDLLEPAGGDVERGAHHQQGLLPPTHDGPYRAVVLLDAGDDASASRLLPWGPRAWAARADANELGAALFRPLDTDAPQRARALGWCVVSAGERYGGGRHSEPVARATAALGVRAVIAASYSGGHDRLLALHGVLPLTWLEPGDRREVRAGDELEIPPPTAAPGPGGRVSVRHLTRGFTFDVRCDLEVPLRELARSGGLIRAVRDAVATGER
jgi:aconitase family protein (aconitate hydratase)